MESDIWKQDLVNLEGAKLLSRPEMETRKVRGIETPQRFGNASFQVEAQNGETFTIYVGSHYWDAAVAQFADIHSDTVDVTFLPSRWAVCGRSGVKNFFYSINETPN